MNGQQQTGTPTSRGILGFVALAFVFVLLFHFFGFRVVFTGGRPT